MTDSTEKAGEPEQPGKPLRWERDSEAEDFETARATQLDALAQWQREQRLRPLTDMLEAHGLTREDRKGWGGYIVPEWWAQAEPPVSACPWCQAPGDPVMCVLCCVAQAGSPDPASLLAWWEGLSPLARRLHLSLAHGVDPWTGRPVRIEYETIDRAGAAYDLYRTRPPRCSWDLRREG